MTKPKIGPRKKRKPNTAREVNCGACGDKYEIKRALKKGATPRCPECSRPEYNARARKAAYHTRPQYKANSRAWQLLNYYGLTVERFEQMATAQGGVCGICKGPPDGSHLVVDHCHQTNRVRGLLCGKCNRAIGTLGDDPASMKAAVAYLQRGEARQTWDQYFVDLARLTATRSKDRSSQVGAVIVKNKIVLSTGYNGFPRGVNDDVPERHERPEKYFWMVHAEDNAILNAARHGVQVEGGSLYVTPFAPCSKCARAIASVGIAEVIVDQRQDNPRFAEEIAKGQQILNAARVLVRSAE